MNADHKKAQISSLCLMACGTMSPCGGGILADVFNLCGTEWKFQKPECLKSSYKMIENSFICAVIYFILLDPFSYFPFSKLEARDCRAVVGLLMYQLNVIALLFPHSNFNQVRERYIPSFSLIQTRVSLSYDTICPLFFHTIKTMCISIP